MFATDDTIVAVATPPGRGGIGVVRVSGGQAAETARAVLRGHPTLEARRATLATVVTPGGPSGLVDSVLATYFPGPHSYTGEDVVEISGHGNPVLLDQIVEAAVHAGARLAAPGEFTLRAFLHGRVDLVQAEAVGDLIEAVTPRQARVAFDQLEGTLTTLIEGLHHDLFDLITRLEASIDFPEEGYHFVDADAVATETQRVSDRVAQLICDGRRGRLVREGGQVVIVGRPNVGKSTLFNGLLGVSRAIVTGVAGTTRDLLTETLDLDGAPITLVDTAGIRASPDAIESEGVNRARGAVGVARLVALVLDRSEPLVADDRQLLDLTRSIDRVVVVNKTDLPAAWSITDLTTGLRVAPDEVVAVSLTGGDGLPAVRHALSAALLGREPLRDTPTVSNLRHLQLLERTHRCLTRAATAAGDRMPEELVLADLQEARHTLEEITGRRTPDDVLSRIFERFCIGK